MNHDMLHQPTRIPFYKEPHSTVPALPVETWLQILENTQNIELLWNSVRLVSTQHKACVERVVLSHFLPQASVSLSLPCRDPTTGALLYRGQIPGAELSVHYARTSQDKTHVIFRANKTAYSHISIESLNTMDRLSKRRLEGATSWLWFGSNRAKGVTINIDKIFYWDESEKSWIWEADWGKLVSAYVTAKNSKRRPTRSGKVVKS
jgi:hypothetical protein